jgi:hypothetical protein
MDVLSVCPLRVASLVWQPRPGAWTLTLACKATYRLEPLRSPLATTQDALAEEDNHWDDDETRSLQAPSDLAPFKPRADVVLVGHAFAPDAQPVRSLVARLRVGELDKAIDVWCDRIFMQDGRLLEGPRFTKMPLRWERAAGGPETSNPVGLRFDAAPDIYGAIPVPNLQPPGLHVTWRDDTFEPVGFGPIAPTWPGRVAKLYRQAPGWSHRRWFERPLPEGIDAGYFNTAPPDQQVDVLRPDERLILENLHPVYPGLVTNLAMVRPRAAAERPGRGREEVALVCDTLWIDTDRQICALVWRGRLPLSHPQEAGRILVWAEGEGIGSAASSEAYESWDKKEEEGDDAGLATTLVPPGKQPSQAELEVESDDEEVIATRTALLNMGELGPALPFITAAGSAPPPEIEAPPLGHAAAVVASRGDTMTAPLVIKSKALPFQGAPGAAVRNWSSVPEEPAPVPLQKAHGDMPFGRAERDRGATPPAHAAEKGDTRELPAPPPMIGPLATPEMAERAVAEEHAATKYAPAPEPVPTSQPESAQGSKLAVPDKLAPGAEQSPPQSPVLPLDAFPIERCAAIAASMARRKVDAASILEENSLTRKTWEKLDKHWADTIYDEIRRGRTALLKTYDAAYVGRLEEERGPLLVEEYARLKVATERGTAGEVLAKLTLPKGAAMRIERVWLEKLIDDSKLATSVDAAVEAAREEGA